MIKKILFLEYKFRDFSDQELLMCNPTGVMASLEKLNSKRCKQIRKVFNEKGISFTSLPGGDICPASDEAKEFLIAKIKKALIYQPDIIWFDHLRFEGRWGKKTKFLEGIHKECKFCKGKDRAGIIVDLTAKVLEKIPNHIKTGYFAVPFFKEKEALLIKVLGQDHQKLGNIFDFVSPMLYHRMLAKSTTFISEYVTYLSNLKIKAKIIPIIQLKDMPDNLEDYLTIEEIEFAIKEAIKPPSLGVALFSWDQAIEKDKLKGISRILKSL